MQFHPKKIDYTTPAGAQGGPGVSKQITWYVGTPFIDMTAAVYSGVQQAIGANLGDIWWLGGQAPASGGNAFVFAKATVGLTLGQLVSVALPTTGTVTNNAGQSTTASILTNVNNLATVPTNADVDNWVYVNATAATLPQLRRIKANTNSATARYTVALTDNLRPNSPTDKDVFDTLATNADPMCVIRPWNLIVNTATTTPVGVALGTVTAGNFTIIQVAGLAAVQSVGNGVALVANVPAVGSAAGVIIGTAAANLYTGASLVLPQFANAAGPAVLTIPCYVNFTGQ